MIASVYIHIPYCVRKCAYCDFESYAGRLADADEYIARVLQEMERARGEYGNLGVPTLYIGGGTPSLLSPDQLSRLLDGAARFFSLDANAEISMEANPGTVDAAKLRAFRSAGVNRISFGAQASQTGLLALLGRVHTWPEAVLAVDDAFEAGISNINLDLMYALPGQTAEDFAETLDAALSLPVSHLSCYSLILEEGTPLTRRVEAGTLPEPRDEDSVRMQRLALEKTRAAGMERYEISNYARPGLECRHNLVYWERGNYIGFGCAAHSMMNDERFFNPDYRAYLSGAPQSEREPVRGTEKMEETLLLGLRMTKGISLAAFECAYGKACADALRREIRPLADGGLARLADGRFALTAEGMDVQNAVVVRLVTALER